MNGVRPWITVKKRNVTTAATMSDEGAGCSPTCWMA